jgi:hypothetical protein
MPRLMIVFSVLLTCLFALCVGVVCAQPRDDRVLRQFLFAGCENAESAACWGGIVPGETTLYAALARLQEHPWVGVINQQGDGRFTYVYWQWNDQHPAFLRENDFVYPAFFYAQGGVVSFLAIPTLLSYAELFYVMGTPQNGLMRVDSPASNPAGGRTVALSPNSHFAASWHRSQLVVESHFDCPSSSKTFWSAPITLSLFSATLLGNVPFGVYDVNQWLYHAPCPRT